MARPRVFISSTFYDLKYVRSSLEIFVASLGFDAVLFEKGDVAFHPDASLDESCYREAQNADIFVLIIGGRYGSATSTTSNDTKSKPHESYESITRKEFETAQSADVPTFILIDAAVNSEFQTYLKNKGNRSINYAHVDSINIFSLIENIYERRRNNPVFSFTKPNEIESWLREQWAGLFRELLRQRSQQKQLSTLNAQVGELQAVNATLKNYLEAVLNKVSPDASANIIKDEERKLKIERETRMLEEATFYRFVRKLTEDEAAAKDIIRLPSTERQLFATLEKLIANEHKRAELRNTLQLHGAAQQDYNFARRLLGLAPIEFENDLEISRLRRGRTRRDKDTENGREAE